MQSSGMRSPHDRTISFCTCCCRHLHLRGLQLMCCCRTHTLMLPCAGTFIYVAFMEVLPRELSNPDHRLAKLGMLTLGFGLMSLLAIWA